MTPDTLDFAGNPQADVYQFGLLMFELTAGWTMQERRGQGRTMSSQQEEFVRALENVKDQSLRYVIMQCLKPVSERISIDALGQSQYFYQSSVSNERLKEVVTKETNDSEAKTPTFDLSFKPERTSSSSNHNEVQCEDKSTCESEPALISTKIPMHLVFRNEQEELTVDFEYDLRKDTPEAVAEEMITQLQLDPQIQTQIAREIKYLQQKDIATQPELAKDHNTGTNKEISKQLVNKINDKISVKLVNTQKARMDQFYNSQLSQHYLDTSPLITLSPISIDHSHSLNQASTADNNFYLDKTSQRSSLFVQELDEIDEFPLSKGNSGQFMVQIIYALSTLYPDANLEIDHGWNDQVDWYVNKWQFCNGEPSNGMFTWKQYKMLMDQVNSAYLI